MTESDEVSIYRETQPSTKDIVLNRAFRLLGQNPDCLSGQSALVREAATEAIRRKDPTGGLMAQYDAMGIPFLADTSHGVPKEIEITVAQSGQCDSANHVVLRPEITLADYVRSHVTDAYNREYVGYGTTLHEVAHTTNAFGRKKDGTVAPRRGLKLLWEDAVKQFKDRPQYQEIASRTATETHSILTQKWLLGKLDSEDALDILALDILQHPHVFSAAWYTPAEASRSQVDVVYQQLMWKYRDAILQTGKPPEGGAFGAVHEMYQITQEACKNHFRMLAIGMNLEEIGLYLSGQTRERLAQGIYEHKYQNWEADIEKIAKEKGIVPQTTTTEEALGIIDKMLPSVRGRIKKECQTYNDALTGAAALAVVTALPRVAEREGLTVEAGKIKYQGQTVEL